MKRRTFIGAALALPAIPVVALVPTAPLRDPLIDRSIDLHAAVWIRTPWHERPEQPWFDIGGNEETHIVPLRNNSCVRPYGVDSHLSLDDADGVTVEFGTDDIFRVR